MGLWKQIRKFQTRLKDRRGQSTIEYILILFIVVMIAMRFKSIISTQVMGLANKVGSDLEKFPEGIDGG